MKNSSWRIVLSAWILLAGSFLCGAPKTCPVKYQELYPVLDGRIQGDPAWEKVPWQEGFFLHRKESSPKFGTKFKALYTKDAFYVAAECYEEDVSKLKKVYNFNEFWVYDTVELFLETNPGEVVQFIANYESMTYETIPGSLAKRVSFRTGWKAAGARGEKCWCVEFCIPFYLLGKVPSVSSVTFPGNLCRNSMTTNERSTWSFQKGAFRDPAGFGRFVLEKAPSSVKNELEEALKKPHWLSLAARWKSIRKDPAWAECIDRFPGEKAALEKLFSDEENLARNSSEIYKNLSRIEEYISKREERERKRIWKRLFDE